MALFGRGPDEFAGLSALGPLSELISTGAPFDTSQLFDAIIQLQGRNTQRGLEAIDQRFAGSGGRFSSDLLNASQRFIGERQTDLDVLLANIQRQSFEPAKARQLTTIALLEELARNARESTEGPARTLVGTTAPSRTPGLLEQLLVAGASGAAAGFSGGAFGGDGGGTTITKA